MAIRTTIECGKAINVRFDNEYGEIDDSLPQYFIFPQFNWSVNIFKYDMRNGTMVPATGDEIQSLAIYLAGDFPTQLPSA